MDFIDTFELRFPGLTHALVAARFPSSSRDTSPPTGNTSNTDAVAACVDGSRWIVRCPDPLCSGAEVASFKTGLFFCCECRNVRCAHDYINVLLPNPEERDAIEGALLVRPDWRYRAWIPGETVQDLLAQNAAAGL